jgi:hypothetical protein
MMDGDAQLGSGRIVEVMKNSTTIAELENEEYSCRSSFPFIVASYLPTTPESCCKSGIKWMPCTQSKFDGEEAKAESALVYDVIPVEVVATEASKLLDPVSVPSEFDNAWDSTSLVLVSMRFLLRRTYHVGSWSADIWGGKHHTKQESKTEKKASSRR